MKTLISLICFVFLFVSCSDKKDNVKPEDTDLAAKVAGTYKGTKYVENGLVYNIPNANFDLTVGLKLTRISNTKADGLVTVNLAGIVAQSGGEVDLKSSGSRIEMYDGTTKVGYVEGNKIYYKEVDDDGTTYEIEGTK